MSEPTTKHEIRIAPQGMLAGGVIRLEGFATRKPFLRLSYDTPACRLTLDISPDEAKALGEALIGASEIVTEP